ncbi:DnaJ C-terminal domain-containing protein [Paenibacillus sp. WLX1005]|uniref:DnaJ C-terminal domain-containing protein n=1 Tax=unclassified Paenibacillus TaxID=185978 RepID=UPI00398425E1
MSRSYYDILGVSSTASKQEVKKAYQKLAKQWHPDVNKDEQAESKFKEITEAYETIGNEKSRQTYDEQLQYESARRAYEAGAGQSAGQRSSGSSNSGAGARREQQTGAGRGFVDEDLFDMFFGERMNGYDIFGEAANGLGSDYWNSGSQQRTTRATMDITLEQAYRGDQLPVQLGSSNIHVKIPERIQNDRTIRIRGTGANGISIDTELLITLHILPHGTFQLDGSHLLATLQIAPWEAVFGSEAQVQLPDTSRVRVKVPAGIQSGRKLRIPGKGLKDDDSGYGDLMLSVEIVVPTDLSVRERELYEELSRTSRYRARMKRNL